MIERTHLLIALQIHRQGSLTRAAQALHLTQSAVSHAIRKLEQQVGTPLWEKQGRHLQFTEAGNYLLKEAQRLLPQFERLDETLENFALGNRGTLRIGMECHPCYQWLLREMEPFLAAWPSVDVDVIQRFQFGGMAALFNHDIDVLVTPDPLSNDRLEFYPAFAYEQVLVLHSTHPLAQQPWVSPQALRDQVLYTYPVEPSRLDIFRDFLLPANCQPKKHKIIETTEIMLRMVASQRGVTCLPQWLVEQLRGDLPLTTVKLGHAGLHKSIYLGVRSHTRVSNRFVNAFMEGVLRD